MADAKQAQAAAATADAIQTGDFATLLNKEFKPQTPTAKHEVERAVQTMAQQALAGTRLINNDVVMTIEAMIGAIDRKITEQMNHIIHNPEFQQLEGAWRGLHHLVNNTESDELLKVRVLNISKKDLHKTLKKFK